MAPKGIFLIIYDKNENINYNIQFNKKFILDLGYKRLNWLHQGA
jgi:hypothetical protein